MWTRALFRPCLLPARGLARRGLATSAGGRWPAGWVLTALPASLVAARELFTAAAPRTPPYYSSSTHASSSLRDAGAGGVLGNRHGFSTSSSASAGSSSNPSSLSSPSSPPSASASTGVAHEHHDDRDGISDAEWAEVVGLLGAMAATKGRPNAPGGWRDAYEYMPVHMQRAGLTPDRLASLNFIHVAGTKGKGSTCAMVESILRRCGYRTGLYTSPHLVDVRERLRLDGRMLPRAEFAASFWRVYNALRAAADRDAKQAAAAAAPAVGMPSFFSFMTIMAMDAFLARPPALRPQVVVLEVGIGGRLDATNAVVGPSGAPLAAAAVTSLGFDHMELLGDTLPKIAREKAGVMKPGRPVLAAPQPEDAMQALQEVAARVGAPLTVPPPLERYSLQSQQAQVPGGSSGTVAGPAARDLVGLGGEHMRLNASLAVALAAEWERQYGAAATAAAAAAGATDIVAAAAAAAAGRPLALLPGGPRGADATARSSAVSQLTLPAEYVEGLRTVSWPGRSQIIEYKSSRSSSSDGGRLTLYLDGAHTPESMATCAAWFAAELRKRVGSSSSADSSTSGSSNSKPSRHMAVLLFNCMRDRDPAVLLPPLAASLRQAGLLLQPPSSTSSSRSSSPMEAAVGVELAAAVFTPMLSGGGVLLAPGATAAADTTSTPPSATATSAAVAVAAAPPPPQHQPQVSQPAVDLSWQQRMRAVWQQEAGAGAAVTPPSAPSASSPTSPPAAPAGPAPAASVLPGLPPVVVAESLPAALALLRGAAAVDSGRSGPVPLHVHVLVTGSLYLVGDMLRLLGRPPE